MILRNKVATSMVQFFAIHTEVVSIEQHENADVRKGKCRRRTTCRMPSLQYSVPGTLSTIPILCILRQLLDLAELQCPSDKVRRYRTEYSLQQVLGEYVERPCKIFTLVNLNGNKTAGGNMLASPPAVRKASTITPLRVYRLPGW